MKSMMIAAAGIALAALPAQAQVVRGAVAVSSPQGSNTANSLSRVIDQSGLSRSYVSGSTDFASFVASTTSTGTGGASGTSGAVGQQTFNPIFTFDLGANYRIDKIAVWSWNNIGNISQYDLYADTNDVFSDGRGTLLGSFSSASDTSRNAAVSSFAPVTTRYVQLYGTSYSGGTLNLFGGTGEVVFEQVAGAAPEPATWGLMILGFGVIGAMLRRRARQICGGGTGMAGPSPSSVTTSTGSRRVADQPSM